MAKAKMAYDTRPQYHFVPETRGRNVQLETPITILRSRSSQNTAPTQPMQPTRSRSQAQRGQKRTNTGTAIDTTDQENALPAGMSSQRPQRTIMATNHHPAKDAFHLCYPATADEEGPARVCFFVNKRIDHNRWRFKEHSRDVCSLVIEPSRDQQEQQSVAIHNIYNAVGGGGTIGSTLVDIRAVLEKHSSNEQILLGDFNLHHPLWGGQNVKHIDPQAEDLIAIIEDFDLSNTLAAGTITYEEAARQTTIDLCLVTVGLVDRVIRSQVDRDLDHDSDHLPISTVLDMTVQHLRETTKRNWKRMNEKTYLEALKETLPPLRRPTTKLALDNYVRDVITAIKTASEKAIPQVCISARAREGWTAECKIVLAESKRLKRRHGQHGTEETWQAYREARNHKARVIRKAMTQRHRDRVEEAAQSPEKLWKLANWAKTRGSVAPRVTPAIQHPTTQHEVTEPDDKATLFRDAFFPAPPAADLTDIQDAEYSGQIEFPTVTEKEVRDAIRAAAPFKAPGPDSIANRALQVGERLITKHLTRIVNCSLRLGYCPSHFRESTTVVLRKPGKDSYTVPKAYRPIALLNTVGKVMDAVIARRLSHLVETQHVLPDTHMGGRRMRSTEHALHAVTSRIHQAWNKGDGQVASLLLLDVSGAFDNVSHPRLLHNLRKRRVDEKTVKWIASFLSNRHTRIAVDGFTSQEYAINTGIPQGSPLSPILYLFFNADLIDECNREANATSTGYIDDVAILAWGNTAAQTCSTLSRVLEKAQRWAITHASVFAPDKFQLTHFTRSRTRINRSRTVQTSWGEVTPKPTCKYLGLTMDSKLQWKEHVEEIRRKATKTVSALSCLGGST
jgi:hypothetical protein